MSTITYQGRLVTEDCCTCHMIFAVPEAFQHEAAQTGLSFYCPRGHSMRYSDPENARLRKRLRQLEARNTHLADQRDAADRERETAQRSAAAYKGQVTKIRKRVGNGLCPCCNRTFANVARHMASQHPDYRDADDA